MPYCQNKRGMTFLEIVIVAVIMGILSVLGLASFASSRELVIDRQAQANLKLIVISQKSYRMATGSFVNCSNTANVDANLGLDISTDDVNWKYRVINATANSFFAQAQRTGGFALNKIFCINETLGEPLDSGCGAVW